MLIRRREALPAQTDAAERTTVDHDGGTESIAAAALIYSPAAAFLVMTRPPPKLHLPRSPASPAPVLPKRHLS